MIAALRNMNFVRTTIFGIFNQGWRWPKLSGYDESGRSFTILKETMAEKSIESEQKKSKIGELSKHPDRFLDYQKIRSRILTFVIPGGANKHFSLSILHWDKIQPVWRFFEFHLGSKSFQSLQNHLQLHHWLHHRLSKIQNVSFLRWFPSIITMRPIKIPIFRLLFF